MMLVILKGLALVGMVAVVQVGGAWLHHRARTGRWEGNP